MFGIKKDLDKIHKDQIKMFEHIYEMDGITRRTKLLLDNLSELDIGRRFEGLQTKLDMLEERMDEIKERIFMQDKELDTIRKLVDDGREVEGYNEDKRNKRLKKDDIIKKVRDMSRDEMRRTASMLGVVEETVRNIAKGKLSDKMMRKISDTIDLDDDRALSDKQKRELLEQWYLNTNSEYLRDFANNHGFDMRTINNIGHRKIQNKTVKKIFNILNEQTTDTKKRIK